MHRAMVPIYKKLNLKKKRRKERRDMVVDSMVGQLVRPDWPVGGLALIGQLVGKVHSVSPGGTPGHGLGIAGDMT